MSALCIIVAAVLVSDQAIKLMLRHLMGSDAIALGPCGSIRVVAGRIWLSRLGRPCSSLTLWCVWIAAAVPLAICSALAPISTTFVGLLLGASLSHAVETSVRGNVTDYICLRVWPAFNLADLALAAGALGLIGELLIIICQKPS
jgi:signal peptidase II